MRVRELALPGATLAAPIAAIGLPGLLPGCPVFAITGVPCPTCGGTRAVHLLLDGDPDFLRFNAFWAAAAAVAWACAAVVAWRRVRGRPGVGARMGPAIGWLRARPGAIVILAGALALGGWVTAMVNLEAIRAG